MKLHKKLVLSIALVFSTYIYASEMPRKATDPNAILLTINNKPVLTKGDFDNLITEITEENEKAKLMLQLIPDFKEQFFKAKKQAIIISEWAKRNGIRNTAEYKKKENRMIEPIKEYLDSEAFIKQYSVDVSDEDALRYYEENKDKAAYGTFEEAKPTIKNTLKNATIEAMIKAKLPKFEDEYKIVENIENLR